MKIIDKIKKFEEDNELFYSFEYFPPKTEAGMENLFGRLERMSELDPAWMDCTWGAGGSTADKTPQICKFAQNYVGVDVLMHLTCTNMPKEMIDKALAEAKENGVENILALRGDPPAGQDKWEAVEGGFSHASDLVAYIRKEYGDYFCISVAGYPEGHLEANNKDEDMEHLKTKVEAGSDVIITQLFYDVDEFLSFVTRCREAGITIPILPGLMPIQTYGGFKRMTEFCNTKVPQEITDALAPIHEDDAAVKEYGIKLGIEMCKKLLDNGVKGLHFYTLNLERTVTKIIEGLGIKKRRERELPWKTSAHPQRSKEDVRPIFWSQRPHSYISKTISWDDFPNGRWGDSDSPAFGDLADYPSMNKDHHNNKKEDRLQMWGEPKTLGDIAKVFVGLFDRSVKRLPWMESHLGEETTLINEFLVSLNKREVFTINSQPRINGVNSNDSQFGWGPKNGYVYQKEYIEVFMEPSLTEKLVEFARKSEQISVIAITADDKELTTLDDEETVTAVTWGIFPNREIIQPTVVCKEAFKYWKHEAFAVWVNEWASVYEKDSESSKLLHDIHDKYYLVSIVDNDYINGSLEKFFEDFFNSISSN
eukprot:CAMPEP_0114993432 /NCGR_PEP_ID=MMETSP0216-20121206/12526_1 /TAXON_ID=223996 /ORGANISM="Protocruzia adherens, Strain Boccale" /LENGTH=592 /DNA_ID=CAMNT_0002357073 /DNA_START=250 /DNA_END=2028 /DNA_ORIENTATION=-